MQSIVQTNPDLLPPLLRPLLDQLGEAGCAIDAVQQERADVRMHACNGGSILGVKILHAPDGSVVADLSEWRLGTGRLHRPTRDETTGKWVFVRSELGWPDRPSWLQSKVGGWTLYEMFEQWATAGTHA